MDDDRNDEIDGSDADMNVREYDDRNGKRAEATIQFSPDFEQLCDLGLDDACDVYQDDVKFNGFNFNLICKVDQGSYYQNENDQQEAKVGPVHAYSS